MTDNSAVRRAAERELATLQDKQTKLEAELAGIQRMINDLKAMHNINAVFRRDLEEYYD